MTSPATEPDGEAIPFLDRDHSILAFNERVLDWARRDDVPLLERLRYLCIVSSNLDEFFEVRGAPPPDRGAERRAQGHLHGRRASRRWPRPRTGWSSSSTRSSTTS